MGCVKFMPRKFYYYSWYKWPGKKQHKQPRVQALIKPGCYSSAGQWRQPAYPVSLCVCVWIWRVVFLHWPGGLDGGTFGGAKLGIISREKKLMWLAFFDHPINVGKQFRRDIIHKQRRYEARQNHQQQTPNFASQESRLLRWHKIKSRWSWIAVAVIHPHNISAKY